MTHYDALHDIKRLLVTNDALIGASPPVEAILNAVVGVADIAMSMDEELQELRNGYAQRWCEDEGRDSVLSLLQNEAVLFTHPLVPYLGDDAFDDLPEPDEWRSLVPKSVVGLWSQLSQEVRLAVFLTTHALVDGDRFVRCVKGELTPNNRKRWAAFLARQFDGTEYAGTPEEYLDSCQHIVPGDTEERVKKAWIIGKTS